MSKSISKNIKKERNLKTLVVQLTVIAVLFFSIEILEMKNVISLPKVFGFGGYGIRTYGLMITAGVLLVTVLTKSEIQKYKEPKDIEAADLLIYLLIFGLIGARLYHVITDWYLFENNFITILYVWNGGLGIFGAIIGGVLGLWLYAKKHKVNFALLVDIIAVFLPLAQILGRAGNLINDEIVGTPTNLPWSWNIQTLNSTFHPVFLYEQIGNLIIFVILVALYKKKVYQPGKYIFIMIYILGYSIVRFIVEFFRIEPRLIFGVFTLNQLVCVFGIIISMIFFIRKYFLQKQNNENN